MIQSPEQLAAELYDVSVPDWDGEIGFYREFACAARDRGQSVLEVACGTGRVTLRLAAEGVSLVGLDLDQEMLQVARRKSEGMANVRWVRGDMRSFDLGRTFGLILIPGHSFQCLNTPQEQVQALENFKRHLDPDGILIIHTDHQDMQWLGGLCGSFEPTRDIVHPRSGHVIHRAHAWTYERATQTATVVSRWQEIGSDGAILQTWERKPMPLHCLFRFEMEHLLARTGFAQYTLYGDFFKGALNEKSADMIWVARRS